jgi:hypothetical protein
MGMRAKTQGRHSGVPFCERGQSVCPAPGWRYLPLYQFAVLELQGEAMAEDIA